MNVFEILTGALAVVVLIPAAVVFTQVMLARQIPQAAFAPSRLPRPSVAVLIPAHNEAEGITATLRSILPQLGLCDRLLVVADNCSDATAGIASDAGAEVVKRTDPARRGKGYALDFGIRHLAAAPPELVIIVDADCMVEAGTIDWLARTCGESELPVQAVYLMHALATASLKMRIAEFAWVLKNWVRPLGSRRLGLPCQLMGTGMAFPWRLISDARLAHAELVEDMKLGIDLALAGYPPLFCLQARVSSRFPDAAHAAATQRTRWEHGHLGMIAREFPRLFGQAIARTDMRLLGLALDLAVPPLALLVVMMVSVLALALVVFWIGLSVLPLFLAVAAFTLLTSAVLTAWWRRGRGILPLAALLSVPFYVLAKIPMYLKFWTRRQKEWVRTERK
ncbi:MAG: glycosyltransferase family 2 protein [Hydrogenophilaceae bacterium]|nr:glycosyltransferase family 2 protein [Hydrogenophilaceae bacterium]